VCHGEKTVSRLKKIDVRIPPGVKNGSKVRVAKEGGRGIGSGDPGDLFLNIQIESGPDLRVEGLNVYGEQGISILEAVLGGDIEVDTLHGKMTVTVPPLTSSGKTFRLRLQGVKSGVTQGDHFVTVMIQAPTKLSTEEKKLYQELLKLSKK
jgi:DnaJ-class molecular chaperone